MRKPRHRPGIVTQRRNSPKASQPLEPTSQRTNAARHWPVRAFSGNTDARHMDLDPYSDPALAGRRVNASAPVPRNEEQSLGNTGVRVLAAVKL
jgi:hypothetical protein